MSIKEYFKNRIFDFFIITTCVNLVMFVLGSIYNRGMMFSYEVLLMPPLYGLVGTVPSWILYSKRELSTKQLIARKIVQFLLLEVLMIVLTFHGENLCRENASVIISFAISVFVVLVCVNLIGWIFDRRVAQQMTDELMEFQRLNVTE